MIRNPKKFELKEGTFKGGKLISNLEKSSFTNALSSAMCSLIVSSASVI